MMQDLIDSAFTQALQDYAFFLNRQYPRREALKLVGNRYLLNKEQRILLTRGVFPQAEIIKRQEKKTSCLNKPLVHIDGFNVLFTLGNYLLGRPLFLSNDSFLRDAGEVRGKVHHDKSFGRAVSLLTGFLSDHSGKKVNILLDEPVGGSRQISYLITGEMHQMGISGSALVVDNPDNQLISLQDGIICTSDSQVIDQSSVPVFDLGHAILQSRYQPDFIDLAQLLA